jgi:hypothetical protein
MKRDAADIFKDALSLPADARATLVGQLLDSLKPQSERRGQQFVQARRRALKRLHDSLNLQWEPVASRDDLHRR